MSQIKQLHELGQSLWYDNIQRRLLEDGTLKRLVEAEEIRGITSNPTIFNNAIAKTTDYDAALVPMAWAGWNAEQIFDQLAIEDIRSATDLFLPLYEETGGRDGFVSIEVNPFLARSTAETVEEARRLWTEVDRPNTMIKIPATLEGIPAIEQAIALGMNVNVTLIFSLDRYRAVMEAYLRGLEQRASAGQPINRIASVASFFVSRVDTKIDEALQAIIQGDEPHADQASRLLGKAAIANAKLAYASFLEVFGSERFQKLRAIGAQVQRPLWASTSTKNPAYRDVIYVEGLIGPDTVDTVPPQTLDAFRDHGHARITLTENLEQAQADLVSLESLGISMPQVTQELEVEGVQAFSDAFSDLLHSVDDRRANAISQLAILQADVHATIGRLVNERANQRLWTGDASLWTQGPAGTQEVQQRLGWLRLPETSQDLAGRLPGFVSQVQDDGLTNVLLLGMGGSSLAPEVFSQISEAANLGNGKPKLKLMVLDSTDPDQVTSVDQANPAEKTLYIVASKSGTTSEINAYLDYFWDRAIKQLGELASRHFIAITDPGTALERLARERNFREVFQADPTVGGRYSALTAFGLVPAALTGWDVDRLLKSAEKMKMQCAEAVPAGRNPGLVLGVILGTGALKGKDKLTLIGDEEWEPISAWLEQLIAESSGKQGKGIVPVAGEPLASPEKYGDDRIFVFFSRDGRFEKEASRLRTKGHPALSFQLSDPYDLGAQFYQWEMATAYACSILNVNAFDQPDVQDNKARTAQKVKSFRQNGHFKEPEPAWQDGTACVYGDIPDELKNSHSLQELVRGFLAMGKPGDYVGLNAYLPRDKTNEDQLTKLRVGIQNQTGLATTVGFGPRFLHSTGQLHKGGPNTGLFIQFTSDPQHDMDIPGEGIQFSTLEKAQALGDMEALQARQRRVIRIHLKHWEDLL